MSSIFDENVRRHPHKVCFHFEGRSWTFRQIGELSNRVAHAFDSVGYKRGDTVALLLENRPEYVAIWLGLAKLGVVTALVNTNLRDKSLLHVLKIVDTKALVFGGDFVDGRNCSFLSFVLDLKSTANFIYSRGECEGPVGPRHRPLRVR